MLIRNRVRKEKKEKKEYLSQQQQLQYNSRINEKQSEIKRCVNGDQTSYEKFRKNGCSSDTVLKEKNQSKKFEFELPYKNEDKVLIEQVSSETKIANNEIYLFSQKQNTTKKDDQKSSVSSKTTSLILCIEQSAPLSPLKQIHYAPNPHYISIKIPMYRTVTFMKVQTQIFSLDVTKQGMVREYQIERRYSEFEELYEEIFYNYPGCIVAPFPGKNIESFIKIKLGLGISQPDERTELIEKRMSELEKFINAVTHHRFLSQSQEIINFLVEDIVRYRENKKKYHKIFEDNKALSKRHRIKDILTGKDKIFMGEHGKHGQQCHQMQEQLRQKNAEFSAISSLTKTQKNKVISQTKCCQELIKIHLCSSELVDMKTQNDQLLKLCARHNSGKQYCKQFANFLQEKILPQYRQSIKWWEQIEKILGYRQKLWQCYHQANKHYNIEKISKLVNRLVLFQNNFFNDWKIVFEELEQKQKDIGEKIRREWEYHKKQMKKIWKSGRRY